MDDVMGVELIMDVLDHAPPDLTPAERLVLVIIAERASDQTREAWPGGRDGWGLPTIAVRAGLKTQSVQHIFHTLARRGLEVRMPIGQDRRGRPVYAHEGHQTSYRLPHFAQRSDGHPPTEDRPRSDHKAPEGGPQSALTVERSDRGNSEVGPQSQEVGPGSDPNPHNPHLPSEELLTSPISPAIVERPEVEQLCRHLADKIEANGSKRPTITKAWRDAARLLIDKDGRTAEQVGFAIDWCQADEFWRGNILSMPTLRKQYDRLRLAWKRANNHRASTGDQRVAQGLALAAELERQQQQAIGAEADHGPQ